MRMRNWLTAGWCLLLPAWLPLNLPAVEPGDKTAALPTKRLLILGDSIAPIAPRLRWLLYDPLLFAQGRILLDTKPLTGPKKDSSLSDFCKSATNRRRISRTACSAAWRLRLVRCHERGTSIQPAGLSMANTDRSSYRIGIVSPVGSWMQFGFATGPC